jgi:hypothetical protein
VMSACSTETPDDFQLITRHVPEDRIPHEDISLTGYGDLERCHM